MSERLERLRERIGDWRDGAEVRREEQVVRNIALAGLESRNGYCYREAALRGAVGLYEGRPVFLDHGRSGTRPQERSTRDLVGSICQVRFEGGRVRGDVRVLGTEAGRTFLALAEENLSSVGMSQVVLAERSGDGRTVERIEEVICVDAVMFPATTTTFREQSGGDGRGDRGADGRSEVLDYVGSWERDVREIDEALELTDGGVRVATVAGVVVTRSDDGADWRNWSREGEGVVLSEVRGQVTEAALADGTWREVVRGEGADESGEESGSQQGESQRERDAGWWRSRYERLREKYVGVRKGVLRDRGVERLLEECRVPAGLVTAEFREVLGRIEDEKCRRAVVRERMKAWRGREQSGPMSVGRQGGERGIDDEWFIRGVRR